MKNETIASKGRPSAVDLHLHPSNRSTPSKCRPSVRPSTRVVARTYLTNLFLLFLHVDIVADRVLVVVHAHIVTDRRRRVRVGGNSKLGNGPIEYSDIWGFMYVYNMCFFVN